MNKWNTQRISLSALLIAVMLILGYVESMIPIGTIPGIKIGLSNSVLLLGLYWFGIPSTICLMVAKITLSSLLFSGFSAMIYSLAGGLLSLAVMSILYKIGGFSPVVIGMAGGMFHNIGQVGMAMLILETEKLVYYMAILMFVGLGTGFATGTIAKLLIERLPASLMTKPQMPNHKKNKSDSTL